MGPKKARPCALVAGPQKKQKLELASKENPAWMHIYWYMGRWVQRAREFSLPETNAQWALALLVEAEKRMCGDGLDGLLYREYIVERVIDIPAHPVVCNHELEFNAAFHVVRDEKHGKVARCSVCGIRLAITEFRAKVEDGKPVLNDADLLRLRMELGIYNNILECGHCHKLLRFKERVHCQDCTLAVYCRVGDCYKQSRSTHKNFCTVWAPMPPLLKEEEKKTEKKPPPVSKSKK